MEEHQKTKDYYLQAEKIWTGLTKAVPEATEFKNNWSGLSEQLENL
jgi:hypothetical protein